MKSYHSKIFYERHIAACSILQRTKNERELDAERQQDIPSIDKCYEIIKTLLIEQTKIIEFNNFIKTIKFIKLIKLNKQIKSMYYLK